MSTDDDLVTFERLHELRKERDTLKTRWTQLASFFDVHEDDLFESLKSNVRYSYMMREQRDRLEADRDYWQTEAVGTGNERDALQAEVEDWRADHVNMSVLVNKLRRENDALKFEIEDWRREAQFKEDERVQLRAALRGLFENSALVPEDEYDEGSQTDLAIKEALARLEDA